MCGQKKKGTELNHLFKLLKYIIRKCTQFLDKLLVLVELFECLNVHVWDFSSLGFIAMLLVTKYTH